MWVSEGWTDDEMMDGWMSERLVHWLGEWVDEWTVGWMISRFPEVYGWVDG